MLSLVLFSIHEFMLCVALFVDAALWFVYRFFSLKAAEMCLTKEENALIKGGKSFSECCAIYFEILSQIFVLTLHSCFQYLKNDPLKKKKCMYVFLFSVLFHLILYLIFLRNYFNTDNHPKLSFICSMFRF